MQRYVEQLIEDIHIARSKVRPPLDVWDDVDTNDDGEIEDMAFVEKYIYGTSKPIEQITRIKYEQLPPDDKLSAEQKAMLAKELLELLLHYNFVPDFPETFPLNRRYSFLRKIWTDKHVELSFGQTHIEFCDYDESECPFVGYCATCEEVKAQFKYDEEIERKAREEGRLIDDDDDDDDDDVLSF